VLDRSRARSVEDKGWEALSVPGSRRTPSLASALLQWRSMNAPRRSNRCRALAIAATTSVILIFGVTWIALGLSAVRQAGV
jgi:hypothetical protein